MIIDANAPGSINSAAQTLLGGELIGMPTETVYGLAADALNDQATLKIFTLKGRPVTHPLIAHVADIEGVEHFACDVPGFAKHLMNALWPGPLTLILHKVQGVAAACTANASTIALRCPSHPVAQALLKRCNSLGIWGLAAPSANRFGRVSPTSAEHVLEEFGETLMILDGGSCEVGIESTIVDCTRGAPVVLRPGILTLDQISIAAGEKAVSAADFEQSNQPSELSTPKSSGTLASHYAPFARLRLLSRDEITLNLQSLKDPDLRLGVWSLSLHQARQANPTNTNIVFKDMPCTALECAKALFAQLRAFDALGMSEIWVEKPPQTPEWAGITDRLQRAAHTGAEHR